MAFRLKGNNIEITRGDTGTLRFVPNNYEFIYGDILYFTVKRDSDDEEYLFQKKITSFIDNEAVIIIKPEDTSSLEYDTYFYDIQIDTVDGTVNTVIEKSKFKVKEEIT